MPVIQQRHKLLASTGGDAAIEAVKMIHPYEGPVINVIPLYRTGF